MTRVKVAQVEQNFINRDWGRKKMIHRRNNGRGCWVQLFMVRGEEKKNRNPWSLNWKGKEDLGSHGDRYDVDDNDNLYRPTSIDLSIFFFSTLFWPTHRDWHADPLTLIARTTVQLHEQKFRRTLPHLSRCQCFSSFGENEIGLPLAISFHRFPMIKCWFLTENWDGNTIFFIIIVVVVFFNKLVEVWESTCARQLLVGYKTSLCLVRVNPAEKIYLPRPSGLDPSTICIWLGHSRGYIETREREMLNPQTTNCSGFRKKKKKTLLGPSTLIEG